MPDVSQMPGLSFRLDETGRRVVCAFALGEGAHAITPEDIDCALAAAGLGDCVIDRTALRDALAKSVPGIAFEAIVGEAVDGQFELRIAPNRLELRLCCSPARGGAPVTLDQVLAEIERQDIVAEIDAEALASALASGGKDVLIASGRAPIDGANGRFESLVPSAKLRGPHLDENGLADFRELGDLPAVKAGDALMRRIHPTAGEPGMDVLGQPIAPKPGKDVAFAKHLDGSALDPKDEDLLIAAIGGTPVLLENAVKVEPVYTAKNVDLRSGNINFPGSVYVTGEISTGMTVKAEGDIHVDSTVEGVTLIAGGDIVVKGGIVGVTEHGRSVHSRVDCSGSCSAHFVQNAHITAGNGIFVREFVMQSDLVAAHQIIVGDKASRKGHIIGGKTRSVMLVKAQIIGSTNRAKTVVVAGPDEALRDRLAALNESLDAATTKLIGVIKLLEVANAKPGCVHASAVAAAASTRDMINQEMTVMRQEQDRLKHEITIAEQARVIADKQFLEGTEICFGAKRQRLTADREAGSFGLKEGELEFA